MSGLNEKKKEFLFLALNVSLISEMRFMGNEQILYLLFAEPFTGTLKQFYEESVWSC